jgi:hypothetical protein
MTNPASFSSVRSVSCLSLKKHWNELIAAIGPKTFSRDPISLSRKVRHTPRSFFEDLSDQSAEVVRRIMSDNMRELLNL